MIDDQYQRQLALREIDRLSAQIDNLEEQAANYPPRSKQAQGRLAQIATCRQKIETLETELYSE